MTESSTINWRKSLQLPKTSFPMRANLAQNEAGTLKRWKKHDVYQALQSARAEAPPFVFHDGPPFANGDIHIGHLVNKVLKDFVVRTQGLLGRRCPFVPGWDCHGLPIEHRVMTELAESGKLDKIHALDDDTRRIAIRRACASYAAKYQKAQAGQLEQLLTLADYGDPYITMNSGYEQAVLEVFADLVSAGLVYRRLKPVHWSIANETALAEAELEYEDRLDPSVWVGFTAADRSEVGRAFGVDLDSDPSFIIWTTTPWTLPANMAIAVGGNLPYVLVRIGDSLAIVAEGRLEAMQAVLGDVDVTMVGRCMGEALAGLIYDHPFCDRQSPILTADHVTLEEGTGLVHTAPGHGTEDYVVGLEAGLDVYCPVQGDGTYDDTVPAWLHGMSVWDANEVIMSRLRETGHLVHHVEYSHSYPHDGRSKTPVIFRSTEQWFIDVDRAFGGSGSLRERGMQAIDQDVQFVPARARKRMRGMVESRPDWCLSRQRSWGLPIPAFEMADGSMLLTAATTRAVAEVFGREGSDAWFTKSPEALLASWDAASDPEAPKDVDVSSLSKCYDIFDVWMESGSSWNAVMRRRGLGYPADLYLEGSDQHRGWFQLSLLPAIGVTGAAPYKTVLTHGFMVDRNGRKMSKSEGNDLKVKDLLKEVGADVCRWWVSSLAYENDVRVDLELFKIAGESYRKVRNTMRYLLSNIGDSSQRLSEVDVPSNSLDAWLLGELEQVRQFVCESMESYEFRKAHLALFDFCNDTLSSKYCVAMKDRLYCDRPDSPRRVRAQAVMRHVAEELCRLLSPILPHTADEAWRTMHGEEACVLFETIDRAPVERAIDAGWAAAMDLREHALRALETAKSRGIEKSLDAGLVVPDPDGVLSSLTEDLRDLLEVSRLTCDPAATEVGVVDLREEPVCARSWRRDDTVAERANGAWLSDRDWHAVEDWEPVFTS